MNRRRFLKYAGATAAGVAASAIGLGYVLKPETVTPTSTPTISQTRRLPTLSGKVGDIRTTFEFQDPPTLIQHSSADARIIVKSLSPIDDKISFQISDLPNGVTFRLLPQDPLPVKTGSTEDGTIAFQAASDAPAGLNLPIQITPQLNEGKTQPLPLKLTIIKNPNPPRHWTVTGPGDHETPLDTIIKNYMQGNDIRGAALAVAKDTKLVFAHGYTWAESEYPITQPTTLFRLASCSKPITGIAINQLIENGSLSLDDKAQDILKMKQPNGTEPPTDPKPSDPNTQGHYFHAITVRNLLQHQIGWGDLPLPGAFDPMWNEEETQKAFNLPSQSLVTKY